jgi:hypothetical protein
MEKNKLVNYERYVMDQSDLYPWERINENGDLDIDIVELERLGYKVYIIDFWLEGNEAVFVQAISK